jgi:hypothetical protein
VCVCVCVCVCARVEVPHTAPLEQDMGPAVQFACCDAAPPRKVSAPRPPPQAHRRTASARAPTERAWPWPALPPPRQSPPWPAAAPGMPPSAQAQPPPPAPAASRWPAPRSGPVAPAEPPAPAITPAVGGRARFNKNTDASSGRKLLGQATATLSVGQTNSESPPDEVK